MPDVQHLAWFVLAGWLLNLTPGPDVLYIVSSALRGGARAGAVAALGITAGCFVHIFAAALGVSALMAASATAFTVLKWVGAAYLVWIGLRMLLSRAAAAKLAVQVDGAAPTPGWHPEPHSCHPGPHSCHPGLDPGSIAVFRRGFLTNALNPKVALFFLAFVPQFIAPGAQHPALAFLLLGMLFNLGALPVNLGWALAAAWLARRVGAVQRGMQGLERVAGALFIGFGLKLALSDNPAAATP